MDPYSIAVSTEIRFCQMHQALALIVYVVSTYLYYFSDSAHGMHFVVMVVLAYRFVWRLESQYIF